MKLRHRIHILQPIRTRSLYGDVSEDLDHFASCYAEVENLGGKEGFKSSNYNAILSHRIIIRYRDDIKPKYYVKYKNRYFKIEYVSVDEKTQKYTYLMCIEEI